MKSVRCVMCQEECLGARQRSVCIRRYYLLIVCFSHWNVSPTRAGTGTALVIVVPSAPRAMPGIWWELSQYLLNRWLDFWTWVWAPWGQVTVTDPSLYAEHLACDWPTVGTQQIFIGWLCEFMSKEGLGRNTLGIWWNTQELGMDLLRILDSHIFQKAHKESECRNIEGIPSKGPVWSEIWRRRNVGYIVNREWTVQVQLQPMFKGAVQGHIVVKCRLSDWSALIFYPTWVAGVKLYLWASFSWPYRLVMWIKYKVDNVLVTLYWFPHQIYIEYLLCARQMSVPGKQSAPPGTW